MPPPMEKPPTNTDELLMPFSAWSLSKMPRSCVEEGELGSKEIS